MPLQVFIVLDPVNWTILFFGLFLGRSAMQSYRDYRRLIAEHDSTAVFAPGLIGPVTLAVSIGYAVLLVILMWSGSRPIQVNIPLLGLP